MVTNHYVTVDVKGSAGLLDGGRVNRDGIGALISFTPESRHRHHQHKAKTSLQAVVAGSSHSSSHALRKNFGLGRARSGTLDILWPGGIKNRLYRVRANEHIVMPEIPCDYAGTWSTRWKYKRCVKNALNQLYRRGHIDQRFKVRLYKSAMRAYYQNARSLK